MEQSQNSISRLNGAVEVLIKKINTQQESFQKALDAEKNEVTALTEKNEALFASVQQLSVEKEKLQADLVSAQKNAEDAQKNEALKNEIDAKTNKINGLQTEVQNLNNALTNRKAQIEDLENKNKLLSVQLVELNNKLESLQSANNSNDSEVENLKVQLAEETRAKEDWALKCGDAEKKIIEMQLTINQTTDNIDVVVARLEKVLEENGASNNND